MSTVTSLLRNITSTTVVLVALAVMYKSMTMAIVSRPSIAFGLVVVTLLILAMTMGFCEMALNKSPDEKQYYR